MTHMTTVLGVTPSPFAFGAMQFGGKADAAASQSLYDACRDAGIRHFDTANGYNDGRSEELLGQFTTGERDQVFVATKCGYIGGASPANIHAHFDQSQKRLNMDFVDLLYMHRFDDDTPLEATVETLARLQSDGKIRYIGVSNYAAWQLMKAQMLAQGMGTRIDAVQPMYNLVKRQAEVEILPLCKAEGIQAIPYSPLGGGLLTGKYASGGGGRLHEDDRYAARYAPKAMHETASKLAALASDLGTSPATLAAAWVSKHAAAPMPILSASNPDQLPPSLDAITFDIDDALYARISDLSAAPPPATDRLEEA